MSLHRLICIGVIFLFLPFAYATVDLLGLQVRFDLLEHRHLVKILSISIFTSGIAAIFAVSLGTFISIAHTNYRLPLLAFWGTFMLFPLICPMTVWTMAQNAFFGEGGFINDFVGDHWNYLYVKLMPGKYILTSLVFTQITMPLCMLIVLRGCRKLEGGGWIAAKHYLTRKQMCWWIIKGLRHEIITSFLLAFSLNLGNFAVPHALQCRLISIEIYSQAINYLDREGAIVASVSILAVAILPAILLALLFRKSQAVTQLTNRQYSGQKKIWGSLMAIVCIGYVVLFWLFPFISLIIQCGDISKFLHTIGESLPEARNSLLVAFICVMLAVLLPSAAALVNPKQFRISWEVINIWAIGVSPLVIALVCSRIGSFFGSRINSIAIANGVLCYALLIRIWPYAFRIFSSGRQGYQSDWEEASRMARMPKIKRIIKIDLPHYNSYIILIMVIAFSLSIGEIEISQMLCAPGYGTLALRLMTLLHFAPADEVAALALFQMGISMTPVFALFVVWKKFFNSL